MSEPGFPTEAPFFAGNPFAIDLQCNRKSISRTLWYSTIATLRSVVGVRQQPGRGLKEIDYEFCPYPRG